MKWGLCCLVVIGVVTTTRAQSPEEQALLDLTTKAASSEAEAEPAPAAASNDAEARKRRREARHARHKRIENGSAEAESSSVRPEDVSKVESPAQEKSAASESAVETIASETKATRRARRRAAALKPPKPAAPEKKTAYDVAREKWHAPAPAEMCAQFQATVIPDLVLQIQGKDVVYVLRPQGRNGGWDEAQLATAREAFGSWPGGPTPHPRTLDLVYAATLHFGCPYVTLISGIRKDRGGSRHSHGLAADIVLPGVDDEELAAYFRAQGFVGVGTYPRAGFVHVDTRDQSFFWIDRSKPNQHGKIVQVRKDESIAADEAARARGVGGFINPPRLQKALRVRAVRKMKAHKAKLEREAATKATPAPAP